MAHSRFEFLSVIGVIGLKAAGKDELCRYLAKHGYTTYRISDAIRAEAATRGIDNPTTRQLQDIGNEGRQQRALGFWAGTMLDLAAKNGNRLVVVNGIRSPYEMQTLQTRGDRSVQFCGVVAPTSLRAARFLARKQAGDPADYAEFLRLDDRDRGIGEPPEGQQVDRCLAGVDSRSICNNAGTLAEFHLWIDRYYEKEIAPYLPARMQAATRDPSEF